MGIFSKIMGTHSERELKRVYPIVDKIEAMGPAMEKLSDEELRAKTDEFKKRLSEGETLDDLLVEAYAVVREAATRVLGMRHYRVQLIGGVILHQGRIAEMKTGEGKTLVSTLPAYLNALEGKGVHIVTVNDYLANRDAEWMGEVHRFLGLSVGVILNSMNPDERRAAYQCDITYATNNELGFDYLRDNMAVYEKQLVQRELNYAIIDEVDSVLIDEARTPLIISGQSGKSTALYNTCDYLAKRMTKGERKGEINKMTVMMGEEIEETGDFIVNEKEKHVVLTEQGVKKVEEYFHLNNLADADNLEIQHVMTLALRANYLMFRDKNYVVKDGEVLIVDEFTGRIMPGRRYSDGLHQAIEAKEGVEVKRESRTLATITLQNFFNKYNKTAGMTGTALTEEEEFREIYGLDVIEIPPNKKVIRVDHDDLVFGTHREKINAIVEEIIETHKKGQPVLVGTITIEGSEEISNRLRKEGIPHTVLNAKFHEKEAEIVAHAGERGAVTIATNMAGRGTDIKLGDGVAELGGLKIIGTERHESRRIDNQLRGRAGRQGDPGDTRFFISLEDDLMRLFGSDKMMKVFNALSHEDGMAIEHKMLSNAVEKAQKKIESNNFAIRKNLLEYDQVNNEQRELIYEERRRVLKGESMHDEIVRMIGDVVKAEINDVIDEGQTPAEWNLLLLNRTLLPIAPIKPLSMNKDDYKGYTTERLIDEVTEQVKELYAKKEQEITEETGSAETFREVERVFLLKVIDNKWMSHIDDMDQLRQSISLQAYAQKDPVVEYRYAGIEMFEEMIAAISKDIVMIMLHIRKKPEVERKQEVKVTGTNKDDSEVERKQEVKVTGTNKDDSGPKKPVQRKNKKVQPNDPCPCGKCYPDGRPIKYKNCCGRNQ